MDWPNIDPAVTAAILGAIAGYGASLLRDWRRDKTALRTARDLVVTELRGEPRYGFPP